MFQQFSGDFCMITTGNYHFYCTPVACWIQLKYEAEVIGPLILLMAATSTNEVMAPYIGHLLMHTGSPQICYFSFILNVVFVPLCTEALEILNSKVVLSILHFILFT
jgi:hypothetical protein